MFPSGFYILSNLFSFLMQSVLAQDAKPAQPDVAAANRAVQAQLPFDDRQDFEDANRGFIATVAANPDPYAFLAAWRPDPSGRCRRDAA